MGGMSINSVSKWSGQLISYSKEFFKSILYGSFYDFAKSKYDSDRVVDISIFLTILAFTLYYFIYNFKNIS